ncbi:hypothetical protein L218DRAFT_423934 [Marasmius fiardii PR-910]|nr:hypothetical protein L218DRAFT_423934 [Marasmius fiardii PR-910]
MTSKAIQDFLTKQILIDKNIVTYRSLSRQQSLHVNDAKNELHAFLEQMPSQQEKVVATYLVSGEAQERRETLDENGMDVDEGEEFYDGDEDIPETRIVLVGEENLLAVKSQFISIDAIYVYALSPSPIHDVDLLCGPMDIVRNFDAQGGSKLAETVGKVITEGIQDVKTKPKIKASEAPPTKQVTGSSEKEAKETAKPAKQDAVKPRPTGKIDFSKAKPKADKEKETATQEAKKRLGEVKVKKEETLKQFESKKQERNEKKKATPPDIERQKTSSETKGKGPEKSVKDIKQKTKAMLSDSEDDSPSAVTIEKTSARTSEKGSGSVKPVKAKDTPSESGVESPSTRRNLRINKLTIVSDDEESEAPVAKKKTSTKARKAALAESDDELKAMMDVDDEEVIRASRPSVETSKAGQDEEEETAEAKQEGETDIDDDIAPLPKKTRKPKKVIPVGRNGLKKKRVMKSRMSTDTKGYMVTEDYSSYESVDEDEPQTSPAPIKGKKGGKAREVEKEEATSTSACSKSAAKPLVKSSSTAGKARGDAGKAGQKNISHFFGSKGK